MTCEVLLCIVAYIIHIPPGPAFTRKKKCVLTVTHVKLCNVCPVASQSSFFCWNRTMHR